MDVAIHIETQLNELLYKNQYRVASAELILYLGMHNQLAIAHHLDDILEQVRLDLLHQLEQNCTVSVWNLVCLGWLISDSHYALGLINSPQLLDLIDKQAIQYGELSLQNKQTDVLYGNGLIINYLIKRVGTSTAGIEVPTYLSSTLERFILEQARSFLHPDFFNLANLSLQPGITGLLLVLLTYIEQFSTPKWVENCVRDTIYALVKLINQVDYLQKEYSFFPHTVNLITKEYYRTNVLSWSEGDLGVALLLYRSAHFFSDPILTKLADCVGTFSLTRNDIDSTEIDSPWFLNGAAGTAAMYGALFEVSQNPKYAQAQQRWMDIALGMLPAHISSNSLSLLTGYPGVLLCQHTLEDTCRDGWKGLFLL